MAIARTMLLHSAIHWTDVADAKLWPLAVKHAVFLYNHMPHSSSGLSPHDLFSQTRWPHSKFQDCHVWGCPVYVLDKTMQDGKKLPRWKPRSTRHAYMGLSEHHASSVPLVLNLETGAITPQYHVVFDDWFATIPAHLDSLPTIDTPEWNQLFGESTHHYVLDDEDEEDTPEPAPVLPTPNATAAAFERHAPPRPLPVAPPATTPSPDPIVARPSPVQQRESPVQQRESPSVRPLPLERELSALPPARLIVDAPPPPSPQREQVTTPAPSPPMIATPTVPAPAPTPVRVVHEPRRSARARKPNPKYANISEIKTDPLMMDQSYWNLMVDPHPFPSLPMALKARVIKDPDQLTYDEAMRSPDKERWMEAAQIEISALVKKGTWIEVPMSSAEKKVLPGTWTFRRKRTPAGEIKKYKARYCVRGDLEDTHEEHSSPVCHFSSVRLFMVLTLILGWKTCSIDFSNAFVQSEMPADKPMWIHLPRGFRSSLSHGICLHLQKSLYGTKIAPLLWFNTCIAAFKSLGFTQSKHDKCLLLRFDMIIVLYVDDAGIGAKEEATIDKLVKDLRDLGFELTKEGSFTEFLGIQMKHRPDGTIELTQTGLIDKCLAAANMTDCSPNQIPASPSPLGSDPDGPLMTETWSYPSIVGMLMYLATNTRHDIQFAVSQVCRFTSNPKQSHATAVKTILRYLKRTRLFGTIMKPSGKLDLDLYVDADFAGLYGKEPDANPDSARSRTGYIIFLSDCPLLSKSVLQTSIACSTLQAEYAALSFSLKTLLPIKRLLEECVAALDVSATINTTVRARVFEDNQGAYHLATSQRLTNRTKYFHINFHWFWEHILSDHIILYKIGTSFQRADPCTKGLPQEPFESQRFTNQGW
jgi:hypothetical protein